MSERIAYDTFRGKDSFGSITVTKESDGTIWARITVNGEEVLHERLDDAETGIPLMIERAYVR
jgi:hypothetical protein